MALAMMACFIYVVFPLLDLLVSLILIHAMLLSSSLISIFFPEESSLDQHDSEGFSHSLSKLVITRTKVTCKGARTALESFPNLKFFKYEKSFQLVASMNHLINWGAPSSSSQSSQQPSHQLGLRDLYLSESPLSKEVFAATLQLCPFLIHVEFDNVQCHFPDENFKALLNLENLQHLVLKITRDVTFSGGILPVLEKFGPKSLETLSLVYLPDANIGAIVQHCPQLRTLNLREVEIYIPADPSISAQQHTLRYLENLCIEGYDDMRPSETQPKSTDLALLLRSSPALVRLHLHSLDNLSDQVLEQAFRDHHFSNLEVLDIDWCPIVTGNGIDLIVSSENPLKQLKISSCPKLEGSWKTTWESKARENNWDLAMKIYIDEFDFFADQNDGDLGEDDEQELDQLQEEDIGEEDVVGEGNDNESDDGMFDDNMGDGETDDLTKFLFFLLNLQ